MYICNQDGNLKIWDFGMLAVSNMWIPWRERNLCGKNWNLSGSGV